MAEFKRVMVRLPGGLAKRIEAWRKTREREQFGVRVSTNAAVILLLEKSLALSDKKPI